MQDSHDALFGSAGLGKYATPREARVESRPESSMMRMGLVAGGIAVVVLGVLTVWSWVGHRHTGTPVIEADNRPIKEKPVDQGGMKVEGANEAILSGKSESKPTLDPAPEAPALGALRSNPTPPLSVITTPPTSSGVTQGGVRVATLDETPTQPKLNANPAGNTAAEPAGTPAAKRPQAVANLEAETAKPVAPAVTKPAAKATTPAVVHGAGHAPLVQLGALPTQAAANAEWSRVSKRYATQLAGFTPVVSSVEHDGKTMWRLRVSGFADVNAATELCSSLKSAGAHCMVLPKG